jgi:two-component system, cell cycle response regulator
MTAQKRVVLVDPNEHGGSNLAQRLRMQGYTVAETTSAAEGARLALVDPPAAVVSDLWMPGISGVQLCRLLNAEAATENVPVILRGSEGQRNRFWAERAGAKAYVVTGRMGDLVRALARAIAQSPPPDGFFTDLGGGGVDIRDRIALHLDRALFESVLAAEVRALGTCGAFDRLFDLFSQFVSQVTTYRWLAVSTSIPSRFGLHTNSAQRERNEAEARSVLGLRSDAQIVLVEDDDAVEDASGPPAIKAPMQLGEQVLGHVALSVRGATHADDAAFVRVIARELAGPVRMASLVEESQRLATVDPLTGLMNRRAFLAAMQTEVARAERYGYAVDVVMLDVDHFKAINDRHGHAVGDAVLAATGALLRREARRSDIVARWGGEEFLVALHGATDRGAEIAAERLRAALEALVVYDADGARVSLSASFGVASWRGGDTVDALIDRADRAMYEAKSNGRNRVCVASAPRAAE